MLYEFYEKEVQKRYDEAYSIEKKKKDITNPDNLINRIRLYREVQEIFYNYKNSLLHGIKKTTMMKTWEHLTIQEIIEITDIAELSDNIIKELRTLLIHTPIIVDLYTSVMQKFINESESTAKYNLIELVKEDIDILLTSHTDFKINKIDIPIDSFNLLPASLFYSKEELFQKILPENTNGKIDMKKYNQKNKVGFIILTQITYNPTTYDTIEKIVRPRINANNVNGVSIDTISQLQFINSTIMDKYEMSVQIIDDKHTAYYYILQTVDGKKYRALTPWVYGDYKVGKYKLTKFLNYYRNKNVPEYIKYQDMQIRVASNNMFGKKIDKFEEHNIPINKIQNDVYYTIRKLFKVNKTTKISEIINLLHSDIVRKKFSDIVEKNYKLIKSNIIETRLTFIKELFFTTKHFMKMLHKLSTSLTKENLEQQIDDIIKNAVLISINYDTNCFSAAKNKESLFHI